MAGPPNKARLGDFLDHGGSIIQGSPNTHVNGIPAARKTDACICAIHGLVYIISGSAKVHINGLPSARRAVDHTSCGALIVTGSPNTSVEPNTIE